MIGDNYLLSAPAGAIAAKMVSRHGECFHLENYAAAPPVELRPEREHGFARRYPGGDSPGLLRVWIRLRESRDGRGVGVPHVLLHRSGGKNIAGPVESPAPADATGPTGLIQSVVDGEGPTGRRD